MFGSKDKKKEQNELRKIIRNSDRGKKQAKKQLESLLESKDPYVAAKIEETRVHMYSQAAYEGDKKAQYHMGLSQAALGNKEVSLEWLTGLAKKGDVKAMKAIAGGYAPGGAYGESREEYRHWTQKAAEAGDAQAQADLGLFYAAKNEKLSRQWYEKSAAQNCPAGCIGLGKACYNEALLNLGKMEEKEQEAAYNRIEKYFLKAANRAKTKEDFALACHELGIFYETMQPDEASAMRAAYFYYRAYCEKDAQEDLESFQRVRDRYRLHVNTADMEKWEDQIFGGHADKRG